MKLNTLFTVLALSMATLGFGQRYGVVDTDYILKAVPEYAQATAQLDKFSEQWAGEVSAMQSELESLKDALASERILLSPAKVEQREQAIVKKQEEVIALQQKYFGPEGLLFQKRGELVQPIQDKVFSAIQAIAQKRKLDLVLDKSSQSGVLFVEKDKDYSDEVIESIK
ncbi:MAG: hypothetical protein RL754_1105 [Bacteroidota bacterium]|jgi:Skp family chaperone for outer membrane proteins